MSKEIFEFTFNIGDTVRHKALISGERLYVVKSAYYKTRQGTEKSYLCRFIADDETSGDLHWFEEFELERIE